LSAGHARWLAYLRQLPARQPALSAGHSPLGALAVLAMLLLLAVQALTGLFANDTIFNNGPLYGYVSGALSDRLTGLHKANFDWLLVLIGLHLATIAFYALWKRTNLVRPMVTGRKPADRLPPDAAIDNQRLWLAAMLVAIMAGALWWVIETAPPASMSFF
jgi:cytochrome b